MTDDSNIKYWIYELRMDVATRLKLESIAEKNHMTVDEFFTAVLENAIQEGKEHPLDFKRFVEHNGTNSSEKPEIELVRYYPVHYGETEYEAAKRAEESTS